MIISCLLTRRCNLKCEYCRLIKRYDDYPESYPELDDLWKNEVSYKLWCKLGDFFKTRDPNVFMLLYGGEPTLYKDLERIVDYYNENNIMYSIITNATNPDKILKMVPKLFGLTCSVDPHVFEKDRGKKSIKGWELLCKAKELNPNIDVVAEVVFDSKNYKYAENLFKSAIDKGIRLSCTIIEKPENKYYDFADLISDKLLLSKKQCRELLEIIEKYLNKDIFIEPTAIKRILEKGSQNLKCDYTKELAYVIDSDFKPRLCLRIRGVNVPNIDLQKYVNNLDYNSFYEEYCKQAKLDYDLYCDGCSWTCAIMTNPSIKEK